MWWTRRTWIWTSSPPASIETATHSSRFATSESRLTQRVKRVPSCASSSSYWNHQSMVSLLSSCICCSFVSCCHSLFGRLFLQTNVTQLPKEHSQCLLRVAILITLKDRFTLTKAANPRGFPCDSFTRKAKKCHAAKEELTCLSPRALMTIMVAEIPKNKCGLGINQDQAVYIWRP